MAQFEQVGTMIDHNILLRGRGPNVMGNLMQSTQAAAGQNAVMRENRLAELYRTQGPGIAAGDPNALNALAQHSPQAALGVKETRQGMEVQREHLKLARESGKRAATELALKMSAEEAAKEAETIQRAISGGLVAAEQGQEALDAHLQSVDPDLVGQITVENIQLKAAELLGVKDALEMVQGPGPQSTPGKVQADIDAGLLPPDTPLRTPGQTFNLGNQMPGLSKLGEGYTYLYTEDGYIKTDEMGRPMSAPIPGSKAAAEAAEREREGAAAEEKKTETTRQSDLKLGSTLQNIHLNISEVEDGGLPVTGPLGETRRTWMGRVLTGSDSTDFQNRNDAITDSAAFAELQNMRDNSPTGGAVGQLTDPERKAIGNSVTALNTATGKEEYLRAAKTYRELALNIAFGEGKWSLDDVTGAVTLKLPDGSTMTVGAPVVDAPNAGKGGSGSPQASGAKTSKALDEIEALIQKYGE